MSEISLVHEVAQQPNKRKLTKKDFLSNKKPIRQQYNFASDVKHYPETRYTQISFNNIKSCYKENSI